jgi:hypothetical protein
MIKPVTFVSKKRELRIIVKPADRQYDEARRPIVIPGERVEFRGYKFTTDNEGLIKWLRRHPLFGSAFTSNDPIPDKPTESVGESVNAAPVKPVEKEMSFETPITKDEINILIEQKMDALFNKIVSIVQSQAQNTPKEPSMVPKKTFKCPYCEEVFRSGIEVGKHKKLAHPDKI